MPKVNNLKIKYKKKTQCLPIGNAGIGDCSERVLNAAQNPNLNPNDTSYIFKGIDYSANALGLLQNTKYEFQIRAEATVGGRTRIIESPKYKTTTHPPLVFDPPVVTQKDGWLSVDPPIQLESFKWLISGGAHVRLVATSWGPEQPGRNGQDRYKFAFVAPKATGVQIGTAPFNPYPPGNANHVALYHKPCKWGNNWPQSDTSAWTAWNDHVHLIRCGFGDGTTPITVKVVNDAHKYEWDAVTIRLSQPRHDANHTLHYTVGCMATPTFDLNQEKAIDAGASAWNNANLGVEFDELNQSGGCAVTNRRGRIVVERYNDPSYSNNPDEAPRCNELPDGSHPVGCARLVEISFPHAFTHAIIINDKDYQWASDEDENQMILRHEYYLPWVVAHEFGHTTGLGHSANSSDVMSIPAPQGRIIDPLLTASDRSAMESIYKTHVKH